MYFRAQLKGFKSIEMGAIELRGGIGGMAWWLVFVEGLRGKMWRAWFRGGGGDWPESESAKIWGKNTPFPSMTSFMNPSTKAIFSQKRISNRFLDAQVGTK
jgi:hypothetical protein